MAVNNDNEPKGSSLLSERKSKRLEEALSSYSPEKTKQAVGRLLEEYIDEGGKNYFGAGRRDTTLYFADDDYVNEMKKQNNQKKEDKKIAEAVKADEIESIESETVEAPEENKPEALAEPELDLGNTTVYEPVGHIEEEEHEAEEKNMKPNDYDENIVTPEGEEEEEYIPRRRRSDNKDKKKSKKKQEEYEEEIEVDDDYDDEDYDDYDDYDDDDDYYDDDDYEEVKKKKFFGFFSRKNRDDDEEYDDDDFDDEEYDDDDYYDDEDYDDYEERGSVPVKKIFNIILIVLLVCAVAVLLALCMNYKNLYESTRSQVEQGISQQDSELQAELESLKTENEALKADVQRLGGGSPISENSNEVTTRNATGTAAMTPDEAAQASGNDSSSSDSSNLEGKSYTVKSGDTAQKITIGVYGEYTPELWEKLKKANGKSDTDWIAGENVVVP